MISVKYITSLAFSQLCGAGGGCKKTPLYFFTGQYYRRKKNQQNEFCCAVWSISVLIAVRACSCLRCYFPEWTHHYYIFVSVEKSEIHGFGKKLHLFQLLTTFELCVSIEWVSKFAFYVAQGARENGWLPASEADALGRCRSIIILCKQNFDHRVKL